MKTISGRLILFFLAILSLHVSGSAENAEPDTLCAVSNAQEIMILSNCDYTSITVKGIEGGQENYYYQTGSSDTNDFPQTSYTKFKNPSGILITETDGKTVSVSFTDPFSNFNTLSFEIPDPANRFVRSYTSSRRMDFGISLGNKGKSEWSLVSAGLGLGWVTPLNTNPAFQTSMGRSLEFTWAVIAGVRWNYGPHSIIAGLGIDWRNYSLKRGKLFNKEEDGTITVADFEKGYAKTSSRLQTFSLQVPFLYSLSFGRKGRVHFNLGPVVCFNTGAHISTKFHTESRKYYSIKTVGLNQMPVTVDLLGGISYCSVGVYVRYAPMRVLKSATGLDFKSLSTGVMFFF